MSVMLRKMEKGQPIQQTRSAAFTLNVVSQISSRRLRGAASSEGKRSYQVLLLCVCRIVRKFHLSVHVIPE